MRFGTLVDGDGRCCRSHSSVESFLSFLRSFSPFNTYTHFENNRERIEPNLLCSRNDLSFILAVIFETCSFYFALLHTIAFAIVWCLYVCCACGAGDNKRSSLCLTFLLFGLSFEFYLSTFLKPTAIHKPMPIEATVTLATKGNIGEAGNQQNGYFISFCENILRKATMAVVVVAVEPRSLLYPIAFSLRFGFAFALWVTNNII